MRTCWKPQFCFHDMKCMNVKLMVALEYLYQPYHLARVPLEILFCLDTHPIGSTHGLEVDAVAFGRWQWRIPETAVALVVSHREWLNNCEAGWRQLCSDVVGWVQDGGIAEADRGGETLRGLGGGAAGLGLALLLHNKLIGAGNTNEVGLMSAFVCWSPTVLLLKFSTKWTWEGNMSSSDWIKQSLTLI